MKLSNTLIKLTIRLLAVYACTVASTTQAAERSQPVTVSIGISPFYSESDAVKVRPAIARLILEAPPGSSISVSDAFALQSISTFEIPRLNYDSGANRARLLAQPLATLLRWFNAQTNPPAGVELKGSASLRTLEWLDQIAVQSANQPRVVLVIGSPIYRSPREESFSMTELRVPSDRNLTVRQTESPYGTVERKGRLNESRISWVYLGEDVWGNPLHRTTVTRFWHLYVAQLGARLTYFGPDLSSGIASLANPPTATQSFALDPTDTKIEMRIARPREIPTWLPQSAGATITATPPVNAQPAPSVTPIAPAPIQTIAVPQPAAPVATTPSLVIDISQPIPTTVDIGIMWESAESTTDLDLHVWPRPGAEEIWYQKTQTPNGVLIHDWTEPNSKADLEWIKLNPPVRIDQIEAWVNLYKGRGPISGRVAVHFNNQSFTGSFHISASHGNGGIDVANRANSPFWTRLDIQKIITQNQ